MASHPDLASLFLRKAAHDEYVVLRLLSDPEAPDEVLGFHAQQFAEKLLKAVLATRGCSFRKTHDLVTLMDDLIRAGVQWPKDLEEIRRLNPFAVEFRYTDFPQAEEESLDRVWLKIQIKRLRRWAATMIPANPGRAQKGKRKTAKRKSHRGANPS